jgi:hypothetical protein
MDRRSALRASRSETKKSPKEMSVSKNQPSILLDAARLRGRPPRPFRWVDPRLIQEGRIESCRSSPALALYLILILTGNQHGISYYGERALCRLLNIEGYQLRHARRSLIDAGLIAYQKPYYQVLSLDKPERPEDNPALKADPPAPKVPSEDAGDAEHTEEKRKEILTMLRQFRERRNGGSSSGRS